MTVHLFCRSSYSFLASSVRVNDLVRKARGEGFAHVCLTDHHVMYGVPSFLKACKEVGIHGIVGLEADIDYHGAAVPFLLLAGDNIGYINLMRLSSYYGEGHQTASLEQLKETASHCFLIAYGEGGYPDRELIAGDREGLRIKINRMAEELPPFDMALSYQEASLWKERNKLLKQTASGCGIRTVALNKIYYLNEQDAVLYRCISGIRLSRNINDTSLPLLKGRYFLSDEQMRELYDEDDLQRSDEIAASCRGDYILPKASLPEFKNKDDVAADVYLRGLCYAGLKKRLGGKRNGKYEERLAYELDVIIRMRFENYFLIVYDFIRFARKQGIYIGPGRGSAAGSLVAYCLGITMVDPVKYNLLFERFLNPERVSMPDIDTDIPDDRRQEVISYLHEKYGGDHVGEIVTFSTFAPRQALRDSGKYLGLSSYDVDRIVRLVGNKPGTSLRQALKDSKALEQIVNADDRYRNLYDLASSLEGLPRQAGTHAAGVILSGQSLPDLIPTTRCEGLLTSQYAAAYLEERGLIKMDLLGLRNLTTIDEIVRNIKTEEPDFDIMDLSLADPEIYRLFASADTAGIFQFESEGMKKMLRQMKPACFEDIVAAIALYRPAAMDFIPAYIKAKKSPASVSYPVRELEPVLKDTYGVMIYQEQAMLTARICAGFSLGRADVLRKAMTKKKDEDLAGMRKEFINGCMAKGYDETTADGLFELVRRFGGYGFNRSHAVAYALIACQMAYLKSTYPLYFYAALLNGVIGDFNKSSLYINEARRRSIGIIAPDVNRSEKTYRHTAEGIIIPFAAIKGIGFTTADIIVKERADSGPYVDYWDFVARMQLRKISRRDIEAMIDAGALDAFGANRTTLKNNLDEAERFAALITVGKDAEAVLDFGLLNKPDLVNFKADIRRENEAEREALGYCLGPQPITRIREKLNIGDSRLAELSGKTGKVVGFARIENVRPHRTKKGQMMAFLNIADETAQVELLISPLLYQQVNSLLVRGAYIRFHAKISENDTLWADDLVRVNEKE